MKGRFVMTTFPDWNTNRLEFSQGWNQPEFGHGGESGEDVKTNSFTTEGSEFRHEERIRPCLPSVFNGLIQA
jgi:hypothetical protein